MRKIANRQQIGCGCLGNIAEDTQSVSSAIAQKQQLESAKNMLLVVGVFGAVVLITLYAASK